MNRGEDDEMKYALIGILAVFVASAFVLSTVSAGSMAKAAGQNPSFGDMIVGEYKNGNKKGHNATHDDDHNATDNDTDENEMNENWTLVAGGGGWHGQNMSATIYKDTFGVFIVGDSGNWSNSSFVFQARDQGATLHALNFTNIVFDNTTVENMTFVHAWGWASYDKVKGFWFHLVLMDNGTRSNDLLDLTLYKDSDKNWTMDETTPLLHWIFDGLDGGNIWVGADVEEEVDM